MSSARIVVVAFLVACRSAEPTSSPLDADMEVGSSAADLGKLVDTPEVEASPPAPMGSPGNVCPADLVSEPPCNPALADSPWAASHRSSYAQGSSPLEAPRPGQALDKQHVYLTGIPTTFGFSGTYADGGRVLWASPISSVSNILKLDAETLEALDEYIPGEREDNPPPPTLGVSGAYNLVDKENRFVVARARSVEVFADAIEGDRRSPIVLVKRFTLPDAAFCGANDALVGVTMTYDGHIAFATERGVVGTAPREPARMTADAVVTWNVNAGGDCSDEDADIETISNSIAADESGGIYAVTSGAMYRIDWDGAALTLGWRSRYEVGKGRTGVRLGAGSGSTPTLMGVSPKDDRFVVITDGQDLMHLVLMWSGEIPADWTPVAPGRDRRIACEIPITFGNPAATSSVSEQSVLVRGYSSIVVNNQLADPNAFEAQIPVLQNLFSALEGGNPAQAPYGIERVDWNPQARRCEVVWSNPEPSIPNAIPTMSERTGLIYAHGQQKGVWGLEAIDFATGARVFFEPAPDQSCNKLIDSLQAVEKLVAEETLERLPRSCENSAYAAAQVGPDGTLFQGTFYGMTRYRANAR